MNNFTYANPTRLHFGRRQITKLSTELPEKARVLDDVTAWIEARL